MHTILHLIFAFLIIVFTGMSTPDLFYFLLATILVDIDHLTDLMNIKINSKKDNFFSIFNNFYDKPQKSLHFFHTVEVIALLFLISYYFHFVYILALAFLSHLLADIIGYTFMATSVRGEGWSWTKNLFLTYFLIKGSIFNDN